MASKHFFTRSKENREEKKRAKARKQVEREYAKNHPDQITVVQPESRAEMRLTKKGRFELGSDGQLTDKGKTKRLAYRYNRWIIFVAVLIILTYLFFFFVNFN